jgi:hypothetical protein
MIDPRETTYNLSFTGASLRPELAVIVAEHYLELGDWDQVQEVVRETNALQCRTANSLKTLETEMRLRLAELTQRQLEVLATGAGDDRIAMSWLAAIKRIRLAFDFAAEVLRGKLEAQDPVLRPSDYESFYEAKTSSHPELERITESSRGKIRQVLFSMLTEAGLLGRGRRERPILRVRISPVALQVITEDDPRWLAGFLLSDDEISR